MFWQLLVYAFLVETLVNILKFIWNAVERTNWQDKTAAILVGLLIAILGGVDLFTVVGAPLTKFSVLGIWPGVILTGLIFSRGANLIHEIIKFVQASRTDKEGV